MSFSAAVGLNSAFRAQVRGVFRQRPIWVSATFFFLLSLAPSGLGQNLGGVGLFLRADGRVIRVAGILTNSPAQRSSSIQIGDAITAVAPSPTGSFVATSDLPLDNVVSLLRGPVGSPVHILLRPASPPGSPERVLLLTRGDISGPDSWGDGQLLTNGIRAPNIGFVKAHTQTTDHLSDYLGITVVLQFGATWCAPCQAAVSELERLARLARSKAAKIVFIAAYVQSSEEIGIQEEGRADSNSVLHVSVGPNAVRAFHVDSIPVAYILDTNGFVREAGYFPRILLPIQTLLK